MRYFVHDLETDKLLIHTAGKADWLTIAEADRDQIKRHCLWSKSRNCWISRAKAPMAKVWLKDLLDRLGFEDRGEEGERLTFEELLASQQERAQERAERFTERAQVANAEAHAHFNSHNIKTLIAMQGEPVKLGHHSARRHLRLIEKADNDMRKGCEAMDSRDHYQHRAQAATETAEGAKYQDPAFLGRRIEEAQAEERQLLHRLEGKMYAHSDPQPISEEYKARLNQLLEQVREKLAFYRKFLETCGRQVFDKASLQGKKFVKIRGQWEEIVRLNPKTVSVYNICFQTRESQAKWPLKYLYAEVQEAK